MLISFRIDWLDLLAVQGSLKSLFQHHNLKAFILQCFPDSSVGKQFPCNAGDPGSIRGLGRSSGEQIDRLSIPVFLGFPCGSAGKESICNAGDLDSIPGLGRSPAEGKGYTLQYSGL